jgi:hypothetical protein
MMLSMANDHDEPDNRKSMSTSSANSSRFMTNQEFSDQEKQSIRSFLLQANDELQEVQQASEITPAQRARRKGKLILKIFHYKVALAPHKILPDHVLQLIFQLCVPQDEVCVPSVKVKPWLRLTRICSSWRTLAINTPELWRVVAMELRYIDDYEHKIQVAHQWLKRAGNMTRSLRISTLGVDEKWCSEAIDRLVLPFRFRSLDLLISHRQFYRILSLPPQFTQSLENIQFLATSNPLLDPNTDSNTEVSDKFLNLNTLRMTATLSTSHLMAMFPWRQLRSIFVWGTTSLPSSFINILGDSAVLEELRVTIYPDRPVASKAPTSFITLPNLRRLDLGFVGGSNAEWFLRLLILPKVETFRMSGLELDCTSLSFANLAQRSGMNQIRSLYLGKGREPYQLDHLLKHTPSLSYIQVQGRLEFDSGTLDDMSTGRLGPNLENIELLDVLDVFGILDMARKRFLNAREGVLVKPIMDIIVPEPQVGSDDLHLALYGLGIKLVWLA